MRLEGKISGAPNIEATGIFKSTNYSTSGTYHNLLDFHKFLHEKIISFFEQDLIEQSYM